MLNIIRLKKNRLIKHVDHKYNNNKITRYFPPSTREWFDSVYVYNKKFIKNLPYAKEFIGKLINSYFNMYNIKLFRKGRLPKIRKWKRRKIGNRLFISRPELKHTNDKVIIGLYIYNRPYNYLIKKLRKKRPKWLLRNRKIKSLKIKFRKIRLIKALRKSNLILYKINKYTTKISIRNKNILFFRYFMRRILRKQMLYVKLKKIIIFNQNKFKSVYLTKLTDFLEKIYKKKIKLNITTLRYYHLNSDIYSQIVLSKFRNPKNKRKATRILNRSTYRIHMPFVGKNIRVITINEVERSQNILIKDLINKNTKDGFNKFLEKSGSKDKNIQNLIIKSTNYKIINGLKFKASGRLTKRIKAQKSIYKIKQKGTLANKRYSAILRGNAKSNLQYTFLSSKTRIGSFGLKGWLSAC